MPVERQVFAHLQVFVVVEPDFRGQELQGLVFPLDRGGKIAGLGVGRRQGVEAVRVLPLAEPASPAGTICPFDEC